MLLSDALPELAGEMALGFCEIGRPDLAEQVWNADLVDRCPCNEDFCATIYMQPNESWEGHLVERYVVGVQGSTCLYAVDGEIAWIEILWRPEIRDRLRELIPFPGVSPK